MNDEKEQKGPVVSMPEYIPGSERHTDDYEAALRAIIDGDLDNVEPVNGSFSSLIRSLIEAGVKGAGK